MNFHIVYGSKEAYSLAALLGLRKEDFIYCYKAEQVIGMSSKTRQEYLFIKHDNLEIMDFLLQCEFKPGDHKKLLQAKEYQLQILTKRTEAMKDYKQYCDRLDPGRKPVNFEEYLRQRQLVAQHFPDKLKKGITI